MEPDDPQATAIVKPGEPSQAGGAGLGLDPGTVIEVTTVVEDSYEASPKVWKTTLERLEEDLAWDIEAYFSDKARAELWQYCDRIKNVYHIDIDESIGMLVVVWKDSEYTVKRYVPLRDVIYMEQTIIYVEETKNGLETFKVGHIKGFRLVEPVTIPLEGRYIRQCYLAVYPRFERIARGIVKDLTGDAR